LTRDSEDTRPTLQQHGLYVPRRLHSRRRLGVNGLRLLVRPERTPTNNYSDRRFAHACVLLSHVDDHLHGTVASSHCAL